jgi:hypothetical protein
MCSGILGKTYTLKAVEVENPSQVPAEEVGKQLPFRVLGIM